MPEDPNWLYSTTAQSAAAIVAIVGGFLVSRVVALSSEANGLRRRSEALRRIVDENLAEQDVLRFRIEYQAQEWFVEHATWEFIEADGSPNLDLVVQEHQYLGSNPTHTRAMAEEVGKLVKDLLAIWRSDPRGFAKNHASGQWLVLQHDFLPGDGWEDAAVSISRSILEAHEMDPVSSFLMGNQRLDDPEVRRQEDRIKRLDEVALLLRSAVSEDSIIRRSLAGIGRPEGLGAAIAILAAFAAVGIVWPLTALSMRPVPSAWFVRAVTIVAFAGGLAGVIAFMFLAVPGLDVEAPVSVLARHPDDETDGSRLDQP